MQFKDKPKIQKEIRSKIPVTWSQDENIGGIRKEDTQVQIKKVRWSDLEEIKVIKTEAK